MIGIPPRQVIKSCCGAFVSSRVTASTLSTLTITYDVLISHIARSPLTLAIVGQMVYSATYLGFLCAQNDNKPTAAMKAADPAGAATVENEPCSERGYNTNVTKVAHQVGLYGLGNWFTGTSYYSK